jgi:hypothetical protein
MLGTDDMVLTIATAEALLHGLVDAFMERYGVTR